MNTNILGKLFSRKFFFAFPTSKAPVVYQKYYFYCQSCAQHFPRSDLSPVRIPGYRMSSMCRSCGAGYQAAVTN